MNETLLTLWLLGGTASERVPVIDCHMLAMTAVEVNASPGASMTRDGRVVLRLMCGPYDIRLPLPPAQNQCREAPGS